MADPTPQDVILSAKADESAAFSQDRMPPSAGIDSFTRFAQRASAVLEEQQVSESYNEAGVHLRERQETLDKCGQHFRRVATNISNLYSYNASLNHSNGDGNLPSGLTRDVHMGLLTFLPNDVKEIWGNQHLLEDPAKSDLFRVFGWSFNKMMKLDLVDGRPDIAYISRGSTGGDPAPYPMHTHVDVPKLISSYGLTNSMLTVALCACHDAFEEGKVMHLVNADWETQTVNLDSLIDKFPNGLGRQLAIGVAALTESSESEMLEKMLPDDISSYRALIDDVIASNPICQNLSKEQRDKIHHADPLVFGGLAVQVKAVVQSIAAMAIEPELQLSSDQLEELATSIISVEIGDRKSDISSLERHLAWYTEDQELARYKTVAYISRMLNMHSALSDSIQMLPETSRPQFDADMESYLQMLVQKLDEVNQILEEGGQKTISVAELETFHSEIFMPLQSYANRIIEQPILEKTSSILSALQ